MRRSVLMMLLVLGLVVALTESAPSIRAKRGEDDSDESVETADGDADEDPLGPAPLGPAPLGPAPLRPRQPGPRPRVPRLRGTGPQGSANPNGRATIDEELRALEDQAILEQQQRRTGNQGNPPPAFP